MEGVACQIRWARDFAQAYGASVREIRAVGGGAIGAVWVQIIADQLDSDVLTMATPQDAGALGVGALALVALGREADVGFLREAAGIDRIFRADAQRRAAADRTYARYLDLHRALRPLYHEASIAAS
jgi:xylulokinase